MHAIAWYCTYLVFHYMAFNWATWLRDCVNHCKHKHDEKGERENSKEAVLTTDSTSSPLTCRMGALRALATSVQ